MPENKVEIIDTLPEGIDWGLEMINAPKAWELTKGEGVKVAVIDTGIDASHPDLSDNIKSVINMQTKTRDAVDDYGHGTHVAGLIAGKNTGVAPAVDLYVAKVLDAKGLGNMANILDGITYAIHSKVDILSMSLGVNRRLPLILEERLKKAHKEGITIVCATGNSGIKPPEYPAFYDFAIGVGGVDQDGQRTRFSNFGVEMDIVAPAIDILSTHLDGKYARMTGTSMASPLVVGAVALIKSHYRNQGKEITTDEIKQLFARLSDRKTKEYGYGILDLSVLLED
jgi:subtilisin family serine protease